MTVIMIRDGFRWYNYGTHLVLYPGRPFEVDGIWYNPCTVTGVPRRMIETFEDEVPEGGLPHGVPHYVSSPLTEAELDHWVRHGHIHWPEHDCKDT